MIVEIVNMFELLQNIVKYTCKQSDSENETDTLVY